MGQIRVVAERIIGAPPDRVYGVLRNYREHHPKILPPVFSDFRVEEGGVGVGTVVAFTMNAGGRRRRFRARIEEPEPGRVLRETDLDSGAVTAFTVTPEGSGSRVRIETSWQGADGFGGLMERLFAPRLFWRI
ncbi:MAG: SRPBCC family protein, partial [Chloroflexota bacterium]